MNLSQATLRQQVRVHKVASVYKHTWTLAISHPIAALLLLATFWDVAHHGLLLLWFAVMAVISLIRIPLYLCYRKHAQDYSQADRWGRYFAFMAAVQGCLYGVGWFAFVPAGDPEFLSIVGMWVMGLSACAVIGYAADPKTLLAFFLPVVLSGIAYLLLDDSSQSRILAAAMVLYGTVILLALSPVYRSIISSIESNIKLQVLSQQDGLTGLANRRHFDDALEMALARASKNETPLSLLLLDIDHFKAYNDHYGHVAGDHCLRLVSDVISECVERSCPSQNMPMLARYGGEEFALLLPQTNNAQLRTLAQGLQDAMRACAIPHEGAPDPGDGNAPPTVSLSIGGTTAEAVYPESPVTLIEDADTALYGAKHQGRNRSRFYCRKARALVEA